MEWIHSIKLQQTKIKCILLCSFLLPKGLNFLGGFSPGVVVGGSVVVKDGSCSTPSVVQRQ